MFGGAGARARATATAVSRVILEFLESVSREGRRPRGSATHPRNHVQVTGRAGQVPEAAGDHHGLGAVSHAQPLHHGAAVHVLGAHHGHPVRR